MPANETTTHLVERVGGRDMTPEIAKVFGDLRGRTDGDLQALCFAADGLVYSVEEGGILRAWDPVSGEQREALELSDLESCWTFNKDGQLVASGGSQLMVWRVATGTLVRKWSESHWATVIAFSPDGKYLASGHADKAVRVWDIATGAQRFTLDGHGNEVCALAFSPDGTLLASAGEDRQVILWNTASGALVDRLVRHTDHIDDLTWSHSGHRLAVSCWDTSVRIWNPHENELLALLNGQGDCVHTARFSPDDRVLFCGDSDSVVRVWDYDRLEVLAEYTRHRAPVTFVALNADGTRMATGGGDRTIQFWDLLSGKPVVDDPTPLTAVQQVVIAPHGEMGVLHDEGALVTWQSSNHQHVILPEQPAQVTAIAHGEQGLWAIGLANGTLSVRTKLVREPIRIWRAHGQALRVLTFATHHDWLASAGVEDRQVKIWHTGSGELVWSIVQPTRDAEVQCLAFHPQQPLIAVGGVNWKANTPDGMIGLWDIEQRELARMIHCGAWRVAFSPVGDVLAVVSADRAIALWDTNTGKLLRELYAPDLTTTCLGFSPDGRFLTAAGQEGEVRLWDCRDWRLLATIDLETSINDLVFAHHGKEIITGNENSTCYAVSLRDWIDGSDHADNAENSWR